MISLRKILRYVVVTVKTAFKNKKVQPDAALTEDLKREIILNNNTGSYLASWKKMMEEFKYNILNGDVENFLKWNIVRNTITSKNSTLIDKEYEKLKNDANFRSKWKPLLIENPFGNPELFWKDTNLGTNKIHQVYHLMEFYNYSQINFSELNLVVEFGGGYGNMCYLFNKLKLRGKYFIFDLPEMLALQKFYLNNLHIKTSYILNDKNDCTLYTSLPEMKGDVDKILTGKLFVATWSFSESPVEIREQFIPMLKKFDYFLIAFQNAFDEVNNLEYFKRWTEYFEDISWEFFPVPNFKNDFYLFGKIK